MPKTKFQDVIFTIMMVIIMVYAMICYNIAISMGGLSNKVFLMAFSEMPIMCAVAFVLEFLVVGRVVKHLTFKTIDPAKTQPIFITLMISPQASGRKRKEPPGQCGVPRCGVGGEEPGGLLWLRRIVPGGGGPADYPRPDGADGGHHRLHRRSADESCDAADQRKKGCRGAVCPGGL